MALAPFALCTMSSGELSRSSDSPRHLLLSSAGRRIRVLGKAGETVCLQLARLLVLTNVSKKAKLTASIAVLSIYGSGFCH